MLSCRHAYNHIVNALWNWGPCYYQKSFLLLPIQIENGSDSAVRTHGQFGECRTGSLSAKGILLELEQLQGHCRQSLARWSVHQHILTHKHTHTLWPSWFIDMFINPIHWTTFSPSAATTAFTQFNLRVPRYALVLKETLTILFNYTTKCVLVGLKLTLSSTSRLFTTWAAALAS